jgi:hypothetical protein
MKSASLCLLVICCVQAAFSQTENTDLSQKISDALTKYGQVPVTRQKLVPTKIKECHESRSGACIGSYDVVINRPVLVTTNELLTVTNVTLMFVNNIAFDKAVRTELPDQGVANVDSYQNCLSNGISQQFTLQQSFQRNVSFQVTHSVTNSSSAEIGFTYKGIPKFDISGKITIGHSETNTEAHTTGTQDTVTRTRSTTIPLQPKQTVFAALKVWPVRFAIPFRVSVRVEADLSKNDNGLQHLSDILNETQRTFDISGILDATDASEGKLVVYDVPFDPNECNSGVKSLKIGKDLQLKEGQELKLRIE